MQLPVPSCFPLCDQLLFLLLSVMYSPPPSLFSNSFKKKIKINQSHYWIANQISKKEKEIIIKKKKKGKTETVRRQTCGLSVQVNTKERKRVLHSFKYIFNGAQPPPPLKKKNKTWAHTSFLYFYYTLKKKPRKEMKKKGTWSHIHRYTSPSEGFIIKTSCCTIHTWVCCDWIMNGKQPSGLSDIIKEKSRLYKTRLMGVENH